MSDYEWLRINKLEADMEATTKSLRLLANDYANQRAVNMALVQVLEWFKAEGYNYAVCEKLEAALREAIKP